MDKTMARWTDPVAAFARYDSPDVAHMAARACQTCHQIVNTTFASRP